MNVVPVALLLLLFLMFTSSKSTVCGQLECIFRTVPPLPRELMFTLLYSTLRSQLDTAGISQKCLWEEKGDMFALHLTCNNKHNRMHQEPFYAQNLTR